jgi:hypothetical protein
VTSDPRRVLHEQRRCLLGFATPTGPLLAPTAYWSDGEHLWMSAAGSSVKARRLREHPECVVYVPACDGQPGAVARGDVRVFRAGDPVGLLFHGAAITGAMAALAVSNVSSMLGYAQDAASIPARWAPPNRVVLRLRLDDVAAVPQPVAPPGVAPPLPAVVPSDVRRALAGKRRITLAVEQRSQRREGGDDGRRISIGVVPAGWGAGFRLALPAGVSLAPGTRVAAVLDDDAEGRPTGVVGLALRGTVGEGGRLRPERATWWRGFRLHTADVTPQPTSGGSSGVVLPD